MGGVKQELPPEDQIAGFLGGGGGSPGGDHYWSIYTILALH
jgi:hypothetical protein